MHCASGVLGRERGKVKRKRNWKRKVDDVPGYLARVPRPSGTAKCGKQARQVVVPGTILFPGHTNAMVEFKKATDRHIPTEFRNDMLVISLGAEGICYFPK